MLHDTEAVVTGSIIPRFLLDDQNQYIPVSLDIVCPGFISDAPDIAHKFVIKIGGEETSPGFGNDNMEEVEGIVEERAYDLYTENVWRGRSIRLFLSSGSRPSAAVPWTWSTHLVNYITCDGLVVAYPKTTFDRVGLIPPHRRHSLPPPRILIRTARRPFLVQDMPATERSPGNVLPAAYCADTARSFADAACFKLVWSRSAVMPLRGADGLIADMDLGALVGWQYILSATFEGYTNPRIHLAGNRGLDVVLVERIFAHVPIPTLWSTRLASKFWYYAVKNYLRRKHTQLLRKYVDDEEAFRSLMRRTGTIISGSEALDFVLHGTSCPPVHAHDMDIYANSLYALSIVLHLRDLEGYRVIVERRLSGLGELIGDYGAGVVSVTTLVNVGRGTKLQVVCVARLSAVHQISLFWSTLVMNFLTADGFSMAYPSLTLRGIGLVSTISNSGISKNACIAKYIDRGFTIVGFEADVYRNAVYAWEPPGIERLGSSDGDD
ncbi:uncharacterized protein STEHIDRAFT_160483 [Stereum hirsutum FP-91666 SS1]|uniref:uncharacterized protein n=1 Tax=Stereum hirsutum (strain FP-91666) TaxID=721885 RepID=UPI0004449B48|nr:uncharacterized protein STEHIDRAFT_160483 [Stereum hirsutum FP-91666 SS1]EIM82862.1 hypothetical protein STEHIDRAFT_160483 [Stereum hirsutum FP-91666 SS1]